MQFIGLLWATPRNRFAPRNDAPDFEIASETKSPRNDRIDYIKLASPLIF